MHQSNWACHWQHIAIANSASPLIVATKFAFSLHIAAATCSYILRLRIFDICLHVCECDTQHCCAYTTTELNQCTEIMQPLCNMIAVCSSTGTYLSQMVSHVGPGLNARSWTDHMKVIKAGLILTNCIIILSWACTVTVTRRNKSSDIYLDNYYRSIISYLLSEQDWLPNLCCVRSHCFIADIANKWIR